MNHTSGLAPGMPAGAPRIDWRSRDAFLRGYLALPVRHPPGKVWAYSNLGYGVLAAVVEKVSGRTYEQFCIERLFRPAGMKTACFIGSPGLDLDRVPLDNRGKGVPFAYGTTLTWGYRGSGGAVATTREMHLWDRALRGRKVLKAAARKEYYRVGLEDYALGWYVRRRGDDTMYEHSGSVGKTVTYYARLEKAATTVALAYAYRPGVHPQNTTARLLHIVEKGRAPR